MPTSDVFYAGTGQNGYIFNSDSDCAGGTGPETYLDVSTAYPFISTYWDNASPHTRRLGFSFWDTSGWSLTPGNYITQIKFDIWCKTADDSTPIYLAQQLAVKGDYADAEALFLGLYPASTYTTNVPTTGNWSSIVLGATAITNFLLDTSYFSLGILPDVANAPTDYKIFNSTLAVDEFAAPLNIPFLTITQDVIPGGGNLFPMFT